MLLPHIHVNRLATGIHMSPPNWISLPRPSPLQPSTWPQSTSPGWPASCSILALVIYSAYGNIHASVPFSQTIHPTLAFSHRIQMDLEPFIESQVSQKCNGTPLQYSCLENPMDGGAWWAAVHGAAEGRTRLSDFPFTFMHWRRKWQPTPVFLPGESQGRGSLVGCCLWGCTGSDTTEAT